MSDSPRRKPMVVGLVCAALAGLLGWVAQSEFALVTSVHNGEMRVSSYVLQEDDFHHPRLQLLRRREKLDDVVSAGRTQFEKIVLLRHWVRSQWETGGGFYYPPWDAVEILDLAREYGNRGFCAQYAVVFLQACQSMGIHARYVDLPGHFVVAVWSDDYNRWVIMDPTRDVHYERDGLPMRGGELYRAYWTEDVRGICQVDATGRQSAVQRADLDNYRLYSIDMLANQLSHPVEIKINGLWKTLDHASDFRTYPKIGRDEVVVGSNFLAWRVREVKESFPQRPETQDPDDFRYALNQTLVLMANERLSGHILKLSLLSSNSPTFGRFLLRSDESTHWIPDASPTVKWVLHPGMNQFSARIETSFGWQGNVSAIRVLYKPPLFSFLPSYRGNVVRMVWHRAI
jgi:hypothetical protein